MFQQIPREKKPGGTPARGTKQPSPEDRKHAAFGSGRGAMGVQVAAAPVGIQPKLTVNTPGDAFEREADTVADQVMRMPGKPMQRKCADCDKDEKPRLNTDGSLMRAVSEAASAPAEAPQSVHDVINGGGHPLDMQARSFMEPRFGQDFSRVRVHTDSRAADSARAVNAQAYTVGHNVVFGAGRYNPAGDSGRRLLAHELTHVVQQGGGVRAKSLSEPGNGITARHTVSDAPRVAHHGGHGSVLQRAGDDEFSTADATAVKNKWAKEGALKETDAVGETGYTQTFFDWKRNHQALVTAVKKKKKNAPAVDEATLPAVATWLGTFDAHEKWNFLRTGKEPAAPGAAPKELALLGGNPPAPAYEQVKKYSVTVPGGGTYAYKDHVRSGTIRIEKGVFSSGTVGDSKMISDAYAGIQSDVPNNATVAKVFAAVSNKEGRFDAINTYDAGYISSGFIQFISGKDGGGSLRDALYYMKANYPAEFASKFHNLGVDVNSSTIVVVDPADGTVLTGAAAIQKVIADKRLTALFQEAGATSDAYRRAQAHTAYMQYYLPDHKFSISFTVPNPTPDPKKKGKDKNKTVKIQGHYGDILQSEAGKAAIVDRAVNTGAGGAASKFEGACRAVATKHKAKLSSPPAVAELALYEEEIFQTVKHRDLDLKNFTKPPAVPKD